MASSGYPSTERHEHAHAKGGYHYTDVEEMARQKTAITNLMKKLGSQLLSGEGISLTNITLPVEIFEPRSYLERAIDWFGYAPHYLGPAAKSGDPQEMMKATITTIVSGLWLAISQAKPFNPILGETWQASFAEDGAQIFCEQAAHHPPVTMWELIGDGYHMYGFGEAKTSFTGNAFRGYQTGHFQIDFGDVASIKFDLPIYCVSGMLVGERIINWDGRIMFEDAKNGVYGDITFNPDGEAGVFSGFFGAKKRPTDSVIGVITTGGPYKEGVTKKTDIVCDIDGTWLGWLEFGGERYWDIRDPDKQVCRPVPDPQPLPSDCRFRADLMALAAEDLEMASQMKTEMEEKQRAEAKLRKAGYEQDGCVVLH